MNLLIVRIGAIGDVVMTLAAVEAARRIDPGARVTWLCGELVRPLLEHVGTIDEIVEVDDEDARAVLGEATSDRPPDPVRAARNDRRPASDLRAAPQSYIDVCRKSNLLANSLSRFQKVIGRNGRRRRRGTP